MTNIDIMDKLRILKMIHPDLQQLDPDIVAYREDNTIIVSDLDSNIIDKYHDTDTKIINKFIIHSNGIINSYNNREKLSHDHSRHNIYRYYDIGYGFLGIEDYNGTHIIFNKYLDVIGILYNIRFTKVLKESELKIWYGYSIRYSNKYNMICLNKQSNKIDSFGTVEIDNKISLVSTEQEHGVTEYNVGFIGTSINSESRAYLRYKLAINGNIVGAKSHSDIINPPELKNTNYMYSIECNKKSDRYYMGLIDKQGNELIDASFDSIKYIGGYIFILESNGYKTLFDLKEYKIKFNYEDVKEITQFNVLPIHLISLTNNQFKIVDYKGDIYNVEDIPKHFVSYYSKEEPNILKIEGLFKPAYITTRLVPITNITKISELQKCNWIKL